MEDQGCLGDCYFKGRNKAKQQQQQQQQQNHTHRAA
jgi:hypothetical protein